QGAPAQRVPLQPHPRRAGDAVDRVARRARRPSGPADERTGGAGPACRFPRPWYVVEATHPPGPTEPAMAPKNLICLWFDGTAHDAATFYARTFPDSHVEAVYHAPADFPSGTAGDVLTVGFAVLGELGG